MIRHRWLLGGALAPLLALPMTVSGQTRGLEASYGRWWRDGASSHLYAVTYYQPWIGPFTYGLGVTHLDDGAVFGRRRTTGGAFTLAVGRGGGGLYGVGSAGLGMRHEGGSLDGSWSAGLGYAWQPVSFITLAGEARYRVDKGNWQEAFWRFDPQQDRRGVTLQARMALHFGRRARPAPRPVGPRATPRPRRTATTADPNAFTPPSREAVGTLARASGASASTARTAASVVEAAIGAMGTPYEWGGTDENGFDCSGLIQFAYGETGILIPRVSRDQARYGTFVEPRVADLRPGDILGFSVERSSRITHVGLYVGEGKFIHSASRGVTMSSLVAADPNSRWWQRRWVVARRVL